MAEIFTAIATLTWPLLVLAALLLFWRPLARLIGSADITVKVGGQTVTIKQLTDQQSELVADLQREVAQLTERLAALSQGVDGTPRPETDTSARVPAAVLWVDDNPANNAVLIDRLRGDDVPVDLARSTNEGITMFDRQRHGVVVSDMSRVEGRETVPDAGVRLLKKVRETDPTVPFVIYTGAGHAFWQQAHDAGATEVTSSPMVLMGQLRSAGLLG